MTFKEGVKEAEHEAESLHYLVEILNNDELKLSILSIAEFPHVVLHYFCLVWYKKFDVYENKTYSNFWPDYNLALLLLVAHLTGHKLVKFLKKTKQTVKSA